MFLKSVTIYNKYFPRRDRYPFNVGVLAGTDRVVFRSRVVFFVGENGTGKSTFLEAVARKYGLTVWGGEKTHIVHKNPYETRLYDFIDLETGREKRLIKKGFLFRAEAFFNYASQIDDMIMTDEGLLEFYGGSSLNQLSHGQAFTYFFENRFRVSGLYLLDEPEAALSPANQLAFLKTLKDITGEGNAQFIISTHSPILLSLPGATILSFDSIPIREIAYRETGSYKFYKAFMDNPHSFLGDIAGENSKREEAEDA